MSKTPDEIKKGLEGLKFIANAGRVDAALSYIQQLETNNHQLLTKVEQLQAERDAAEKEFDNFDSPCDFCKYLKKFAHESPCNQCKHVLHGEESQFKWRGVQKEDGNAKSS